VSDDSEPVPKLPRGRGLKFSGPELFRIAIMISLLVALVVLTKPCSHAVSTFVMGFDGSAAKPAGSAGSNAIGSDLIPLRGLEHLHAEHVLGGLHLRRQRGLRDPERRRGATKVAVIRHGDQCFELTNGRPLHRRCLSHSRE
jgi:hypothetical protein